MKDGPPRQVSLFAARNPDTSVPPAHAGPADWNRARAAVSSFLTHFLGHVHHSFRLEVNREVEAINQRWHDLVDEFVVAYVAANSR